MWPQIWGIWDFGDFGFWILDLGDFGFWIWRFRILDFGSWGFWVLDFGDFGFWGFWILGILDFGVWGFWIVEFVTNFGFYIRRRRLCTPTRVGGFKYIQLFHDVSSISVGFVGQPLEGFCSKGWRECWGFQKLKADHVELISVSGVRSFAQFPGDCFQKSSHSFGQWMSMTSCHHQGVCPIDVS